MDADRKAKCEDCITKVQTGIENHRLNQDDETRELQEMISQEKIFKPVLHEKSNMTFEKLEEESSSYSLQNLMNA